MNHTDWVVGTIQSIPALATKTFTAIAPRDTKAPYVVVWPAENPREAGRITGPSATLRPRFTLHIVGTSVRNAQTITAAIGAKFIQPDLHGVIPGAPVTVQENLAVNPNFVGGAEGAPVPGGYLAISRVGGRAKSSGSGYGPVFPAVLGDVVGLRIRLQSDSDKSVTVRVAHTNSSGQVVGAHIGRETVQFVAGVPQDVVVGGTVSDPDATGWRFWVTSAMEFLQVLAVEGDSAPGEVFSGDTSADGGFTYSWAGAPDASVSIQRFSSLPGELCGRVWWQPVDFQVDTDITPTLVYEVVELGFSAEPVATP